MNGFYRITFTGIAGSGFGMLVFYNGIIVGADVGGATYEGSYTENATTQVLDFQAKMNAPAGVTPVQTGIVLLEGLDLQISGSISKKDIDNELPALLNTTLGSVNVIFKKVHDFSILAPNS